MTELETNFAEFKAAMAQFDRPVSLYLDHCMVCYRHQSKAIQKWRLTAIYDYGSDSIEDCEFAKAMAGLIKKMLSKPATCTICGGRMDGACKHVHGDGKDGGK